MDPLGSPTEDTSCKYLLQCAEMGTLFPDLTLPEAETIDMSEAIPPGWSVREGGCSARKPGGKAAKVGERHVGLVTKLACGVCYVSLRLVVQPLCASESLSIKYR